MKKLSVQPKITYIYFIYNKIIFKAGHRYYVNLSTDTLLHSSFIPDHVGALCFSPDDKYVFLNDF